MLCIELNKHEGSSVMYLAAAVSDFYLPEPAEHKIQSNDHEALKLTLLPVPKLLGFIKEWSPRTRLVSFKLETDADKLELKAMHNLLKYNCDLVVANLLQTYKHECILYTKDDTCELKKTSDQDLEKEIVSAVIRIIYL